jgi:hypothetical protein
MNRAMNVPWLVLSAFVAGVLYANMQRIAQGRTVFTTAEARL